MNLARSGRFPYAHAKSAVRHPKRAVENERRPTESVAGHLQRRTHRRRRVHGRRRSALLATDDDPARHLDALPRRYQGGDNDHANRLRDRLYRCLSGADVAPDQNGKLRKPLDLSYAPSELTDNQVRQGPLDRWAEFEYRPIRWVHHRALTRDRIARLDRLAPIRSIRRWDGSISYETGLPRASLAQWLEALVKIGAVHDIESSKAAIQSAALIPSSIRSGEYLGSILLIEDGRFVAPTPNVARLREGGSASAGVFVHPKLEEDSQTLSALKTLD